MLKYRFIQASRDRLTLFWALIFPLILATFFYISIWKMANNGMGDTEASWNSINVSVIQPDETPSVAQQNFAEFLSSMDGDIITIIDYSSEEDKYTALTDGNISGIFTVGSEPSLAVSKSNDINASILKTLLDAYNKNASIVSEVIAEHPEQIMDAVSAISNQKSFVADVDLGGKSLNPNIVYFFALIAYTCLNGAYMGVSSSFQSQANLSALGARRSITPTSKVKLVLTDLIVLVTFHFINIMILTLYVWKVLKIPLDVELSLMIVINLIGSIVGISIGLIIGCTSKAGAGIKTGLCVFITLFPAFLAGLMFGNMKNIIEQHVPIVNRLNPAAVLSDAYYTLGIYNDKDRFIKCIIILLIMNAVLLTIAVVQLRRNRYDSI